MVPTVPLAVALLTTSVGRVSVTVCPPIGEVAAGADRLPGTAALCEMVNDVPPMASVAVRDAPLFAATVKFTVPLPLPDAPLVIVTNVALLVAVHEQPVPAVTGTEPVPPAAANDDVLIVPAVTVHDGVVGALALLLFLVHATASMSRTAAATSRRSAFRMLANIY